MAKLYSTFKKTTFTITTLLLIAIIFFIFSSGDTNDPIVETTNGNNICSDINNIDTINFAGCYDAYSKTIFLESRNSNFVPKDVVLRISFFDYLRKNFYLEVPGIGDSSYERISAETNPLSLEIYFETSNNRYCSVPKEITVSPCPSELSQTQSNVSLELISRADIEDFKFVGNSNGNDIVQEDLVDRERIWESICKSNWQCGPWGECIDNIQKRDCTDNNLCGVPTLIPQRVRACNVECVENWQCEWSSCNDGYTTPSCTDINKCGTTVNKPNPIPCNERCEPNIVCGDWSTCEANYDFLTLSNGDYLLSGKMKRECIDQNSCISPTFDTEDCSLVLDIYTRETQICGKDYINVYNSLNSQLIASIEKSDQREIVNIDLSSEKSELYCDYCFDGLLNGDEEQIDCGGSCEPCENLRVDKEFSKSFYQRFFDGIRNFLS